MLEIVEQAKAYAPVLGIVTAVLIFALAGLRGHSSYAGFGMAVMCYASIVAIPFAYDLLMAGLDPQRARVLGPAAKSQEIAVGAFAALASSACTIFQCVTAAFERPKYRP